jgi:hypothetical protein
MTKIVFATSVMPDRSIIHDDDAFRVQWKAFNAGQFNSLEFNDRLVVSLIAEGCPGSDDKEHPVVYDSDTDGDLQDFVEPPLAAGAEGTLMQPLVGPFPAGSYRLTVTVDKNSSTTTTFNCIEIVNST